MFVEMKALFLGGVMLRLGEYEDIFADTGNELYKVYRFLIYLVRCGWSESRTFIEQTDGKRLSEIEIPKTDLEEEWEEAEEDN